ncbi:sigma factor-like helix-turn-helix DNA-binding protein [Embleya sp. NPDC008237]|uniref:RNA polymerase sigma factor n=1 Tax=Embleya sp. NPDC008237 TaxID=3363978 RepID=UPI0036E31FB9
MGIDDERTEPHERAPGFDALHAAIAPDIARYAYLLTASPARAAYVTRHVFARVWRDLPDVENTPADAARVRTLAGDLALGHRFLLRRALWRLVPHPDRTDRVVPHAEDDAHRDRDIALLRALQRVPSHRRRVFVLRHLYGMSPEQVAVETEATTEATRIRLLHAHEDLAELVPALTGPSPNCPEAHDFLTTITRDLAARHEPRLPGPHASRVGSRARASLLVAVVAAAILALLIASLPPLLAPGTSRDSRGGYRVPAITGSAAARRLPPVPADLAAPRPPAAAPPAPEADTPEPAAPTTAAPEPEPTPAEQSPTPEPAGAAEQTTPRLHLVVPTAGRPADPASTRVFAPAPPARGTAALLAPETGFTLDTSCVDNGLRRAPQH